MADSREENVNGNTGYNPQRPNTPATATATLTILGHTVRHAVEHEIANEVMTRARAKRVTVTLTQRPRGGIAIETPSERIRT